MAYFPKVCLRHDFKLCTYTGLTFVQEEATTEQIFYR